MSENTLLKTENEIKNESPKLTESKVIEITTTPNSFDLALDLSAIPKPFGEKTWAEVGQSFVDAVTPEKPISETLAEVGHSIVEALTPRRTAEEIVDALTPRRTAEEFSQDIVYEIQEVAEKATEAKDYVAQSVTLGLNQMSGKVENVGSGLHAAALDFGEHAAAAKDQASHSINEVTNNIQAYIYGVDLTDKKDLTFESLANKAEVVEQKIDDIETGLKGAVVDFQEKAIEAKDQIVDQAEEAKYTLDDITESVVYELTPENPIMETLENKCAEVGQGLTEVATDMKKKAVVAKDQINEKAEEIGQSLAESKVQVSQAVSDTFNTKKYPTPVRNNH